MFRVSKGHAVKDGGFYDADFGLICTDANFAVFV